MAATRLLTDSNEIAVLLTVRPNYIRPSICDERGNVIRQNIMPVLYNLHRAKPSAQARLDKNPPIYIEKTVDGKKQVYIDLPAHLERPIDSVL